MPCLLYHSELDLLEKIPQKSAWPHGLSLDGTGSGFSPDGRWLLLGNPLELGGNQGGRVYWLRSVDPPGSEAIKIAQGVDFGGLSIESKKMAFFNHNKLQSISFPDGSVQSSWDFQDYQINLISWAPNGESLVAMGLPPPTKPEAFFLIKP